MALCWHTVDCVVVIEFGYVVLAGVLSMVVTELSNNVLHNAHFKTSLS